MTPISCFALWMTPTKLAFIQFRTDRLYGVPHPLSVVVRGHCPSGRALQFLGVAQVFGVGGGLGAQVAELKAGLLSLSRGRSCHGVR